MKVRHEVNERKAPQVQKSKNVERADNDKPQQKQDEESDHLNSRWGWGLENSFAECSLYDIETSCRTW